MAIINGKKENSVNNSTLGKYLDNAGYKRTVIAVEINGSILPKSDYDGYIINDEDIIEIVNFVGGG